MGIRKEKAGVEDLTFGVDTETQYRQGEQTTITQINASYIPTSSGSNLEDELAYLESHLTDESNPHNVSKEQVGLGNVDNTSDLDKPVSNAVQDALNNKTNIGHTHPINAITGLQDELDLRPTHDEVYRRDQFITKSTGASDAGKPIVLDNSGSISPTMLPDTSLYYVGSHNPSGGSEYPDTTGHSTGAFWDVWGLGSGVDYTFTGGDLTGQTVSDMDYMVWDENDGWKIKYNESIDGSLYYKRDGSNPLTAPLQANGQQLKDIADGSDATDAVSKGQLDMLDAAVVRHDGSVAMTANFDAGANRIVNVASPIDATDGVNLDKLEEHSLDTTNPHAVTKDQVGLGNVENLTPADMPISTATQAALDGKLDTDGTAADSDKLGGVATIDSGVLTGYMHAAGAKTVVDWNTLADVEGFSPYINRADATNGQYFNGTASLMSNTLNYTDDNNENIIYQEAFPISNWTAPAYRVKDAQGNWGAWSAKVMSNRSRAGINTAEVVANIVVCTQTEYDNSWKDSNTLYLIK